MEEGGFFRGFGLDQPLDPEMVEHELARTDSSIRSNHILLLTVLNANYPVNVEIIYKVCSPAGKVLRIVLFGRGIVQAMVEFDSVETASRARESLHGCDIYSGCCTLKVEYAKTDRLNVKRNDDKTWDFTDEFLKDHGNPRMKEEEQRRQRPVLLNEPPPERNGGGMSGMGGNMGMGGPRGGMMMDTGMMMDSGRGGPNDGGRGPFSSRPGPMFNEGVSFRGSSDRGGPRGGRDGGPSWGGRGGSMGGMGRGAPSSVCMIYGLDGNKMNCQRVFNIFCQYGNVNRVMFMKSKEGCAMIEMADPEACARAIENLNHTPMFGNKLRLDFSKHQYIEDIRQPHELSDGTNSFEDYHRDRNNRFDTQERAAKNRIIAPTKTIHFYNTPKMDDEDLEEMFTSRDAPRPAKIKWFPAKSEKSASGLLEFDELEEAVEALVIINHIQVDGNNKKYPYDVKLCFSPASH